MDEANAADVAGVPASTLNLIDLSSSDIRRSVSLLKQACLDSGFFYVINHGVSQELMEEVFVQSRRFFGLPLSEKMKLLRNEKHRGYTPLFDQVLDPANQINGDYKEGYYIGVEVPEDDPRAQKPHFGPNLWPSEGLVSDPFKGIYGAGAHSDFGFITLLATDDVPGLQICKNKDAKPLKWEYVQPMRGPFIVNLGDMLERWSNCIFRSTLHRVIGNGQERYSIASFLEPNHDCLIECLPTCMSKENPPKFPPVQCQTYLSQRLDDTHADLNVYRREGA
ncbi:1-aminocyclopropane-1-carboxylate oxidase-like isoform X3 [Eucalyptus grandis]|uniref:1-aminocyclopropane-1-carboxylate oxidase-like isoform X3 n=1 Tax=Eucalyptus grandis TaxID=71139 RepID=UPI00192ECD20|nr:1-aminocyclopropane-1-carboxylate oxidase-like isoform X3 [Eucalyptus grandis]